MAGATSAAAIAMISAKTAVWSPTTLVTVALTCVPLLLRELNSYRTIAASPITPLRRIVPVSNAPTT
jgi:hypothetical protein